MGEMIEFPSNGSQAGGYLALPAQGTGPGVIVIQEWWGLVPHIQDVADRFAAEGFVALAPDLYHGAKDLSGAVDEVQRRSSGDGVGVVGFCMGGGLALVLSTLRPDAVTACVAFYGLIPWPDAQPDFSKLSAAVQVHVAGKDSYFSPEEARKLEATLGDLGKQTEFHLYDDADHAFFNDTRPEVHDAAASALAWGRTIAFLRARLG
ncbi:MAG: dienelactone hydrolase family protein [Acidimicrobiales bacterium]